MDKPLLKLTNINKSFSGVKAINNVSIEILPGTIYCLAGENGCGKSTIIKIISGVYTPDSGIIEFNGKEIKRMTPKDAMDYGIEVIYQDFSVFPNLSVAENIALNTEITEKRKFVDWGEVQKRAKAALDRIHVDIPLDAVVGSLPVASRQLIAISRAIAHNARLLIMDEPTTALTKKEVEALFAVVRGLNQSGISIIFVSHKLDEVLQLSQKIIILRNGENVASGDISEFTKESITYHMTGRNIDFNQQPDQTDKTQNPTVLKTVGLSQKGGFSDISFELHEKEILGITGLLGSGRTALANALFGIRPINAGHIELYGRPVVLKKIRDAIKQGIAYVPEDRLTEGLLLEQTIENNIIITILDRLRSRTGLLNKKTAQNTAGDWISRLRIKRKKKKQAAKALSGGNQQKIVMAKWLARQPRILILNGPTVGVDIGAKTDIITLIKELAADGMSIILASDDVSEIMMCCDRILIMERGRISKCVKTSDITEQELNAIIRAEEVSA